LTRLPLDSIRAIVGQPIRFTPRLDPPPFASINSSPGRGGPPKATYHAYLDTLTLSPDSVDDRHALPPWLHFDANSIEIWGLPRRCDVGILPLMILERKSARTPGSPSRHQRDSIDDDTTETIAGRFELEVQFADEEFEVEDEELRVITY